LETTESISAMLHDNLYLWKHNNQNKRSQRV